MKATELEIRRDYPGMDDEFIWNKLVKRTHQAMQMVVYNLNTLHSRAGSQVPFSSLNCMLFDELSLEDQKYAALACQALLEEYRKGMGKGEQPIFPSILCRVKDGVNGNPGDPYYYLFELATEVAADRLNPTFIMVDAPAHLYQYEAGHKPNKMGCRTAIYKNVNGPDGNECRGNIFPVTINLVRLGIESKLHYEDEDARIENFMNSLDEMLLKSRESIFHRYGVLKNLKGKDMPFAIGQKLIKGSEEVGPEDSIEPILKQNTYGIGFIGLAETLTSLIGEHHGQSQKAQDLGIKIIKKIYDFCEEYTQKDKLNYSCYGTPAEGLSSKFTDKDREKYGIIEGVTDKTYYTNSTHIPVGFDISYADKLKIEGEYHAMETGGFISYIEFDDKPTGAQIMRVLQYAKKNTKNGYIGVNFRLRYCKDCGAFVDSNMNHCSHCGSKNIQGVSRVTGYLSLDERFGKGKDAERHDRRSHEGKFARVYDDLDK